MKLSKIRAGKTKRDLDGRVALILGVPQRQVAVITATFMRELTNYLVNYGDVMINGFGTFSLQRWENNVHILVGKSYLFARIARIRNMAKLEEESDHMDKFAVVENVDQEKLEKHAAQGCPECGSKVERHGTTLICPKCGSAPFEGKSDK